MSNKRFDICTPRKSKDGKTFWTRIGTAWEGDKGTQLVFDALPIPDNEGRVVANLFEPRQREDRQQTQPSSFDDVPFD
jgi:hypothetical protein